MRGAGAFSFGKKGVVMDWFSIRSATNLDLIMIVFLGVLLAGLFKEVIGWALDIITDKWKSWRWYRALTKRGPR